MMGIRHVRARRQQDGSGRLRPGRLRRDRRRLHARSRDACGVDARAADADLGARRRQPRRAERAHAVVSRARRCSSISRPSTCRRRPVAAPFRMPVQWVNRPDPDFRGFAGASAAGAVRPGDRVRVLPSGVETRSSDRDAGRRSRRAPTPDESVTLTLTDEVDVEPRRRDRRRGSAAAVADQFEARLLWMGDARADAGPLVPAEDRMRTRRAPRSPRSSTASTSTAARSSPPARWR